MRYSAFVFAWLLLFVLSAKAGSPAKLVFSTPGRVFPVGFCSQAVRVQSQDSTNLPANVTTDVPVTFVSSMAYYADAGCIYPITSLNGPKIPAGQSLSTPIYLKSTTTGAIGLWALASFGFVGQWQNVTQPSVTVDLAKLKHTVSPHLFGDWVEWTNVGQNFWQFDPGSPTGGQLRPNVMGQLQELRPTLLRYPGGTLSDFFHWEEAIGPWYLRKPQLDPNAANGGPIPSQLPIFGPEEFGQLATNLGAEMMITVNAGSGTALEAQRWLQYYKSKGITPKYWEIGNELYINADSTTAQVAKSALDYARIYDEFAAALRFVDPNIKIGMIGCHGNLGGPLFCDSGNWNRIVLQNTKQKIDFMAVHNAYAPVAIEDSVYVYQATLSAPRKFQAEFNEAKTQIALYANSLSKNMSIAITEHSSYFLSPTSGDMNVILDRLLRNQSLAAALFSALTYNTYMNEPRIQIANHVNMMSPYFQSMLLSRLVGPDQDPDPIPTAFYHVFKLYAESKGGTMVTTAIANSPTYESQGVGFVPAMQGVPLLDSVSVKSGNKLYVYIINRDIWRSVSVNLQIKSIAGSPTFTTVTVDQVNAADVSSRNTHDNPNAVTRITATFNAFTNITTDFPAHSLTRLTFQ